MKCDDIRRSRRNEQIPCVRLQTITESDAELIHQFPHVLWLKSGMRLRYCFAWLPNIFVAHGIGASSIISGIFTGAYDLIGMPRCEIDRVS